MEFGSTLSVTFPKPGKPVVKPATILEDLRRRDFTANAMAISLNEGSYGLLMDPLNGVADIENRELRLVSNYGFIEDPVRMVRAARLMARLGWTLDEKTQTRYQTGVDEGYISVLSDYHRGYETEEIVHEEDPLRVLRRLEADGWMKHLAPYWTSAKVNTTELERLREVQTQLQVQGIHPEAAAANFPLLTAKLSAKEVAELKKAFPRQGFVAEIEGLEGEAKEFGTLLAGKGATAASDAWKLITSAKPEAVLWTAYSSKSAPVQAKLKSFYTDWPLAKTRIPYTTMQEMRITPELAGYDELLEKLFFALMDGKLGTTEEMKAFLEPYSPPAPPPPVSMRRPRAAKKEAKSAKGRGKKSAKADEDELDPEVADEVEAALPADDEDSESDDAPEIELDLDDDDDAEDEEEAEDEPAPKPVKAAAPAKAAKKAVAAPAPVVPAPVVPVQAAKKSAAPVKAVPVPAKKAVAPVKTVAKKVVAPAKKAAPAAAKKVVAVKKAAPAPVKKAVPAPAKKVVVKAVAKKVAAPAKKVAKKR
jgi:tRNA nucleotidyltransferase (CCA-adding enzyme)